MRIMLISALLFLAGCSEGDGRYEQYGAGGYPRQNQSNYTARWPPPLILDTKTGCLFAVERERFVVVTRTEDGKTVPKKGDPREKYGLILRPLDRERC